jgi:hypothetical protein
MSEYVRIQLSSPTILSDLNQHEGLGVDEPRDVIDVKRMRYSHIKEMQMISPEKQTIWAIKKLTGMSDADVDQLYAEDAAEITKTIFGFVEKYFALAKQLTTPPVEEN